MIKYPRLLTAKQFINVIKHVPELMDTQVYIQPKYDGSNITCLNGVCVTRNLNPLPPQFQEGLRRAFGSKYDKLMRLSDQYQVFLELGGTRNSPAGYTSGWRDEWDYRIFDLFNGLFMKPEKVEKILSKEELDYVGFKKMKLDEVINNWETILNEFKDMEGFVLKIYLNEVPRKIKNLRQYNTVMVKFKHEYLGSKPVITKKPKKEKKKTSGNNKEPLPESEIMGAINKAHLQLGEEIFNKKKAMPVIFRLVREEAEKHDNSVPPASKLFKYYQEYLRRLNS